MKLFTEVRKLCKTKSQRVAFNRLLDTFATKPILQIDLKEVYKISDAYKEESIRKSEYLLVKEILGTSSVILITNEDIEFPSNIYRHNDEVTEKPLLYFAEIVKDGEGVLMHMEGGAPIALAIKKQSLRKYFKLVNYSGEDLSENEQ